jgi:RuvB-like protein 1
MVADVPVIYNSSKQVHMLDIECFTYLNRALESPISPIVILASNRGNTVIRGTGDVTAAHGIPPDLLARLLIVPTHLYSPEEIKTIVRLRVKTEGLNITESALARVAEHGSKTSLRYALQLLTPASILARVNGRPGGIEDADVAECASLFIDAKRSANIVSQENGNFVS